MVAISTVLFVLPTKLHVPCVAEKYSKQQYFWELFLGNEITCVVIPPHGCYVGHKTKKDNHNNPDQTPCCQGGLSCEPGDLLTSNKNAFQLFKYS